VYTSAKVSSLIGSIIYFDVSDDDNEIVLKTDVIWGGREVLSY
jgi:hypothetical protein